jgi:uncharacterized tellurite resistance protein B-like protein
MVGFLDRFRKNIISSVWKDTPDEAQVRGVDDKIALGVLLWVVAQADSKFLPQEIEKIKEILLLHTKLTEEEVSTVLASVEEADNQRVDLYQFTSEVSSNLNYENRVRIIEDLFRVACADKDLDDSELEVIRKISGLFHISHKDFIDAKIKIKKEFGLDTAGF